VTTAEADAQTYAALGSIYLKQALCPRAIEMFQKSIQLDPRNTAVLGMLAHCQAKTGNAKEAIISYEQAIAMNDKAVDELRRSATFTSSRTRPRRPFNVLQKSILPRRRATPHRETHRDYEFGQKDYDEAIKYYAMVGGAEAKDAELLFRYGSGVLFAKNFKKAKELLVQVSVLLPKNPEVYRILFDITSRTAPHGPSRSQYLPEIRRAQARPTPRRRKTSAT